ncbi:MAG: D-alanyl-D-alanine carboxypeptidase [Oscillospiraceae bacterium]|nr:D-alanyl-D-alanine carboxypeptidase [Oscillospiraceae bacterium]
MRKTFIFLFAALYAVFGGIGAGALSPDDITAQSAVLIDADTGQILFGKNMDESMHPASITKIMTGLLAMESLSPSDIITVSDDAVDIPRDSSHIALTSGEELSVEDAMYALILPSANDAANALAERIAGSQSAFADMMNEKARAVGAVNTNFVNAHGLSDARHLTTALDMALITKAALETPGFLKYFGTGRYTMPATNKQAEERPFSNYQYMLLPEMWVYNPDIIGGKVGYTKEAGHTMSTAASKHSRTLICVVMNDGKDEKFYDTQALMDYGFDDFRLVTVPIPLNEIEALSAPVMENGSEIGRAGFSVGVKDISLLIPVGTDVSAVRFTYNVPQSLEQDKDADASLTILLPGDKDNGFPGYTEQLPLSTKITIPDADTAAENGHLPSLNLGPLPYLLLGLFLIVLAALLLHLQKRRRIAARRLERRQRVIAERQRRI